MLERPALRQRLRAARRAVRAADRRPAAEALAARLAELGLPHPRSRVAAFHPFDGEIDPDVAIQRARALGCMIYYPVVTSLRGRRMRFVTDETRSAVRDVSPRWLDLVLVPLVGFDARGHRLGMGGGFYDRHFAFLRHRRAWLRPLLVGVAFEVQRIDRLAAAAHDVPLWGVVTEHGIYGRATARARHGPAASA